MDGSDLPERNPNGIRVESKRIPNASRAGALHSHIHSHIHSHLSSPNPNLPTCVIPRESDSAMNEHEQQRIAAAANWLRPDWPVKQLATLLAAEQLRDRPRRDVAVALTWVACDPASASPYRVLEAGPWWRAAAVDGSDTQPRNRGPWCTTCGVSEALHRASDHDFTKRRHGKRDPEAMTQIVQAAKAEIYPTAAAELEDIPMRDHADCEDAINAALAKGDDGRAEFLASRCDNEHGDQTATTERTQP